MVVPARDFRFRVRYVNIQHVNLKGEVNGNRTNQGHIKSQVSSKQTGHITWQEKESAKKTNKHQMKCHEIQPTSCWSSRELCCNDGSVSNAGRLLCYYCCLSIEELYETRSLLANKLIVLDQISLDQIEPIDIFILMASNDKRFQGEMLISPQNNLCFIELSHSLIV